MDLIQETARMLAEFKSAKRMTVHCIMGSVTETFTARTLMALGATPSMTHDAREVEDFVENSASVLIQLSTSSDAREAGVLTAIDAAKRHGRPWLLNPRSAEKSAFRRELGRTMAGNRPKVILGRPRELGAIIRSQAGVDLRTVAGHFKTTAVRVHHDVEIMDAFRAGHIKGAKGHSQSVLGMDAAMSAICAAFCSVETNGFLAGAGAALVVNIVAEKCNAITTGPGSFEVAFMDVIHALKPSDILAATDYILPAPESPPSTPA